MNKSSRALRRHHRARMLARAYRIFTTKWFDDHENALWRAHRSHSNMKICSCCMCQTQRKNPWTKGKEKLTLQERLWYNRFTEELEEYYDDTD